MINPEPVEKADLESQGESPATGAFVEDGEHHPRRRKRRLLIVSTVAAAILIAAIVAITDGVLGGNGSLGPTPLPVAVGSGTVTGVLVLEAGVSAAGTYPLPGTVVLQSDNGKTFSMHVGSDGAFTFHVPLGTYTATGQSPQYLFDDASAVDANGVCRSHGYVVVRAGESTATTVVCEGM